VCAAATLLLWPPVRACGIICWYPGAADIPSEETDVLLDRKRIRKWAKWVYLGLVIVFLAGFLFLGIGYGGAGFNLSEIFNGGCNGSSTATTTVSNSEVDKWIESLKTDPTNTDTMLKIAAYYEGLFNDSKQSNTELANNAIEYLKKALATDPSLKTVYLDLAELYMAVGSNSEAATILNEATAVDPNNPDVYFDLGKVQKALGRTGEAILAWQKFLELTPSDDKLAETIRSVLEGMMTTTTVAPATTTTTVTAGTTTTAASTTTTIK
jgi:tetratricopeptide (TPR) repeat protein